MGTPQELFLGNYDVSAAQEVVIHDSLEFGDRLTRATSDLSRRLVSRIMIEQEGAPVQHVPVGGPGGPEAAGAITLFSQAQEGFMAWRKVEAFANQRADLERTHLQDVESVLRKKDDANELEDSFVEPVLSIKERRSMEMFWHSVATFVALRNKWVVRLSDMNGVSRQGVSEDIAQAATFWSDQLTPRVLWEYMREANQVVRKAILDPEPFRSKEDAKRLVRTSHIAAVGDELAESVFGKAA